MKNAAYMILIILILFVAACQESNRGLSETTAIGDQVKENSVNPVFASTYLGGNGNEFCEAIALDSDGNICLMRKRDPFGKRLLWTMLGIFM